ncbi:hypothetical protein [Sulfitobacter sp.]|uniref:hypothetical protein n=1 Tax=Sulfitobacter sp. TaxID=1903071 RepID=UPI0025FBDB03|nr:hypothetical protein [Sulfitobacter sp.]
MFATISAAFLGYWALMWATTGLYNISIKVTSGALAAWGMIEALQYWGFVVPALS